MTLQSIVEKGKAREELSRWRSHGFTAIARKCPNGMYEIRVGSFGARHQKMKKQRRVK